MAGKGRGSRLYHAIPRIEFHLDVSRETPLSPQELKLIGGLAKVILDDCEQVELEAPGFVITPAMSSPIQDEQYPANFD